MDRKGVKSPRDNSKMNQYVQSVMDFSSQYGKEQSRSYTVSNIRGCPSNYPKYGDFLESCVLRTYGPWWTEPSSELKPTTKRPLFISQDFIELEFEHKVLIESVIIYETYNPGAVVAIYAYDFDRDRWVQVWSILENLCSNQEGLNRRLPPRCSRKFSPDLKRKDVYSNLVRIEFEHSQMEYYSEWDAIELIGHSHNVKLNKQIAKNLKKLGDEFFKKLEIEHKSETNSSAISTVDCLTLTDLPNEILNRILDLVDLKTIFNLRSTCKRFYSFCSHKSLFKSLELKPYWNLIDDKFLETMTDLTDRVKELDLSWTKRITPPVFEKFAKSSCAKLTVLKINNCQYLDSSLLRIITESCPMITTLSLSSCMFIDSFDSVSNLPSLERLNLYRTSINQASLIKIIETCKGLKYLNLGSCTQVSDFDGVMSCIGDNLVGLEVLDLWRAYSLTNFGLRKLATGCKNLKDLDIGWCKNVTMFEWLRILVENSKNLRRLFLTALKMADNEIQLIARNSKLLEQLDILGSPSVSTESIELILKNCRQLKLLDISFCSNIDMLKIKSLKDEFNPNCSIKRSFTNEN